MQREDYLKDLCERLFIYQEDLGIIEPKAEYFIPILLRNEEVEQSLYRNGINAHGLNQNLKILISMQCLTNSTMALFRYNKFHQARDPQPDSLSAIFKHESENLDGADFMTRKEKFDEYMNGVNSQNVRTLVEKSLLIMEEDNMEMTDINLLRTILSSPDYRKLHFGVRNALSTFNLTA